MLEKILNYLEYRVYRRFNIIKLNTLKPGYYDTDTRLLHGMFNLLVDFVEIEKANLERVFGNDLYNRPCFGKRYYRMYRRIERLFKSPRSPEEGLRYLDWEINSSDLDMPPNQREYAKEVKELYLWWKNTFLTRKDEYDEVGLTYFWEKMDEKYKNLAKDSSTNITWLYHRSFRYFIKDSDDLGWIMESILSEEEKAKEKELLNQCWALEKKRYEEETEMLIRLIKIRDGLWT